MSLHSALKYAYMVGVFLLNLSFSVVWVAALQLNGKGWIFVGVGGFAEGDRKGEERVRR